MTDTDDVWAGFLWSDQLAAAFTEWVTELAATDPHNPAFADTFSTWLNTEHCTQQFHQYQQTHGGP